MISHEIGSSDASYVSGNECIHTNARKVAYTTGGLSIERLRTLAAVSAASFDEMRHKHTSNVPRNGKLTIDEQKLPPTE